MRIATGAAYAALAEPTEAVLAGGGERIAASPEARWDVHIVK